VTARQACHGVQIRAAAVMAQVFWPKAGNNHPPNM
jgi:hypothetical protein